LYASRALILDAHLKIEIQIEITVVGGDHANGLLRGAVVRVFAAAAAASASAAAAAAATAAAA
jgi:hypothetical protein